VPKFDLTQLRETERMALTYVRRELDETNRTIPEIAGRGAELGRDFSLHAMMPWRITGVLLIAVGGFILVAGWGKEGRPAQRLIGITAYLLIAAGVALLVARHLWIARVTPTKIAQEARQRVFPTGVPYSGEGRSPHRTAAGRGRSSIAGAADAYGLIDKLHFTSLGAATAPQDYLAALHTSWVAAAASRNCLAARRNLAASYHNNSG
jgi:hypothetical protein